MQSTMLKMTTTTSARARAVRATGATRAYASKSNARVVRTAAARKTDKTDAKADAGAADAKKKALARVLDEIDSNFGAGAIMRLGEAGKAKVATFPSGAMTLDIALGGGLPRGKSLRYTARNRRGRRRWR